MGFGNGAFQAARIAIDGITIIQNITTGKIQTGAPVQITPTTISVTVLLIPIYNNQDTDTPKPFQQMIQLNLSQYPLKGVASDLSNVYFSSDEAGLNKLYSWRETPASLTSAVTWWVLLPNGIPASGTVTIYLQVSSSTALDGVYTGEAPQLSSTYGQYDNGARVFNFYDNFAGTTINPAWTQVVAPPYATVTQNNGVTISEGNYSVGVGLILTNGFTGTQIFEGDVTTISGSGSGYAGLGLQTGNSGSSPGIYLTGGWWSVSTGTMLQGGATNNSDNPNLQISTGIMGGAWLSSSSQVWYENYVATYGSQTAYALPSTVYPTIGLYFQAYGPSSISFQWVRLRAYPPNGVMPIPQTIRILQITLSSTTAGSIAYSMPFINDNYKKFIAYANGYENDTATAQTIIFPVAFSTVANITFNNTGLTLTTSLTTLTISAPNNTNTYTGMIVIEGF